ncbi:MAG: hypothetical protein ICV77_17910 [Cyanobacteria bacterium Co-bin8]|nr:hypothetical protein [Cyanobacteria bacterium Co-bin8]
MTYHHRLYPWCIIRLLPNFQRITVARFRRRNDAEQHLNVLRRLIPNGSFVVMFDAQGVESPELPSSVPLKSPADLAESSRQRRGSLSRQSPL